MQGLAIHRRFDRFTRTGQLAPLAMLAIMMGVGCGSVNSAATDAAAGTSGQGGRAGDGAGGSTGSAGATGTAGSGAAGTTGGNGSCGSNRDCQGGQICYVGVNSCGAPVVGHCVTRLPDGCTGCACLDIVSGSCPAGQGGRCLESGVAGGCWYCALPI